MMQVLSSGVVAKFYQRMDGKAEAAKRKSLRRYTSQIWTNNNHFTVCVYFLTI
jgi:hypothetical protein